MDGLTEGGSYECWGLCALDGDTPAGCVLGYPYPESGVLLIGYIAVRADLRSRGVGGMLLEAARREWYGKAGLTLVLAEIDDPRYHPASGDIDPERRITFYARHQTQLVVGPYFQPRLDGEGKQRVYDMFLAVLNGDGKTSLPGPTIAAFLREYFTASGEDGDWPLSRRLGGTMAPALVQRARDGRLAAHRRLPEGRDSAGPGPLMRDEGQISPRMRLSSLVVLPAGSACRHSCSMTSR